MASPRPKSPGPPLSANKTDKQDTFWEKIGTIGRRKKIKEGQYQINYKNRNTT